MKVGTGCLAGHTDLCYLFALCDLFASSDVKLFCMSVKRFSAVRMRDDDIISVTAVPTAGLATMTVPAAAALIGLPMPSARSTALWPWRPWTAMSRAQGKHNNPESRDLAAKIRFVD